MSSLIVHIRPPYFNYFDYVTLLGENVGRRKKTPVQTIFFGWEVEKNWGVNFFFLPDLHFLPAEEGIKKK